MTADGSPADGSPADGSASGISASGVSAADGAARAPVTREHGGRRQILDPVRRRWVALTPEEGVRQALLADLIALGYPIGLLAVEKALDVGHAVWRADVVAFSRDGRPLLVAECKAPAVAVGQDTFDQLARYNAALGARALVADNGHARYCCRLGADGWTFLDALPRFEELKSAAAEERSS